MNKLSILVITLTTFTAITTPVFASIQAKTISNIRLSMRVLNGVLNTISSNQILLNAATLGNQASATFSTDAVDVAARKAGHGYVSTITAPDGNTGEFSAELDGSDVPIFILGTAITCQPYGYNNTAFTGTAPYDNASMEIKGYGCWISKEPDNNAFTGTLDAISLYVGDNTTYNLITSWNVQGALPAGTVDMIGLATSSDDDEGQLE